MALAPDASNKGMGGETDHGSSYGQRGSRVVAHRFGISLAPQPPSVRQRCRGRDLRFDAGLVRHGGARLAPLPERPDRCRFDCLGARLAPGLDRDGVEPRAGWPGSGDLRPDVSASFAGAARPDAAPLLIDAAGAAWAADGRAAEKPFNSSVRRATGACGTPRRAETDQRAPRRRRGRTAPA